MNLKEAFRYQKFLDTLISNAAIMIGDREICVKSVKKHNINKANPEEQDYEEFVETTKEYTPDMIIQLCDDIVSQRTELTEKINLAKHSADFDIDAAIERAKYERSVCRGLRSVLRLSAGKSRETGYGYKFNVAGDQVRYSYDIDVVTEENFDRAAIKEKIRELSTSADVLSAAIDSAMVNTVVDFDAMFDVNGTIEDIVMSYKK